jgi:hypothetical protein
MFRQRWSSMRKNCRRAKPADAIERRRRLTVSGATVDVSGMGRAQEL